MASSVHTNAVNADVTARSTDDLDSQPAQVHFNGTALPVKTFQAYCDLYLGDELKGGEARVYSKVGERWEVCVAPSFDSRFQQVPFRFSFPSFKFETLVSFPFAFRMLCHAQSRRVSLGSGSEPQDSSAALVPCPGIYPAVQLPFATAGCVCTN